MPYMYSEMQNKLSKTRDSPLESMGQIISSWCPYSRNISVKVAARIANRAVPDQTTPSGAV